MRFKQFLNEKLRLSQEAQQYYKDSKNKVKRHLDNFMEIMEQFDWNVSLRKLCMILTSSYYNEEKIKFIPVQDGDLSFKYVMGGDFWKNGDITVQLGPKTSEYFKKLKDEGNTEDLKNLDSNPFMEELLYVLSHEMVHVKQIANAKGMLPFLAHLSVKEYLSEPQEMEAHALNAAAEIEKNGYSDTKHLYIDLFGNKSKVYKRFLKYLSKFLEKKDDGTGNSSINKSTSRNRHIWPSG